jgi:hypothetical protein
VERLAWNTESGGLGYRRPWESAVWKKGNAMRKRFQQVATAGLLATSVLAALAGSTAAADSSGSFAVGRNVSTDGTTVVWTGSGADDSGDILAKQLGGSQTVVASSDANLFAPAVSGDLAVWVESSLAGNTHDIQGKNLKTGESFTVAATGADELYPALWSHYVAYVSLAPDSSNTLIDSLLLKDLNSTAAPVTIAQLPVTTGNAGGDIFRPVLNDGRLVWAEAAVSSTHSAGWTLKTQQIGENSPTTIDSGYYAIGGPSASLSPLDQPSYDVAGHTLVYSNDFNVYARDLSTGLTIKLTDDSVPGSNPTTNGRYIFWEDYAGNGGLAGVARGIQSHTLRSDLVGYDLESDSAFAVATATGDNGNALARGGLLVYERRSDLTSIDAQLHVNTVSGVLPSAPLPNPGKTSPDWFYFTETQHYLSFGFKNFWVQSGGLPVFGFPLTEEYAEYNRDQGKLLTVQYLERQRYEYHPENVGTPYETELGRLGAEDADRRGLLGNAAFKPLSQADLPGAPCEYFAATGHFVCGNFLNYWHSHGLEFNDPGSSYRESLALFGYPLSEPFTDPATGYTVQYFERARFEWHPENTAPYNLLLGRLGADRLADRGW